MDLLRLHEIYRNCIWRVRRIYFQGFIKIEITCTHRNGYFCHQSNRMPDVMSLLIQKRKRAQAICAMKCHAQKNDDTQ
jgi:hypothetical protein